MTPLEILAAIASRPPRIAVLGDCMLDGWWSGHVERLAREAPVPVLDLEQKRSTPGGAANTARNLAALGAEVLAIGVLGMDEAGTQLRGRLRDAGVDVSRLRRSPGGRTTTKVRVSASDGMVLRLDETQRSEWPEAARRALVADTAGTVDGSDAQLFCDYGSSTLSDDVIAGIAGQPRPALRVVDAHRPERWAPVRPDVVTPNSAEAEHLVGRPLGAGEERIEQVERSANALLEAASAASAVVTLDRSGTVLLGHGAPHRTRARPVSERRASGAGDVFVAALTAALTVGAPVRDAVDFAQHAADAAVHGRGRFTCALEGPDFLRRWLLAANGEQVSGRGRGGARGRGAHESAQDRGAMRVP